MDDPYADLIPGGTPAASAAPDPYADLIPKASAAPPPAASPYKDLVPPLSQDAGGYPTAKNQIDSLAWQSLADVPSVVDSGTLTSEDQAFLDKVKSVPAQAWEGAKAGFGNDQLGFSRENMLKYPNLYRNWQPVVAWLDLAARAPGAVIGAAQGGISEAYRQSGVSDYLPPEMSADRLARDVGVLGSVGLAELALRDPGHSITRNIQPPSVKGADISQFLQDAEASRPPNMTNAQADDLLKTAGGYTGAPRLPPPKGNIDITTMGDNVTYPDTRSRSAPSEADITDAFGSLKGVKPVEPLNSEPPVVTPPTTEVGLGADHPNAPPIDVNVGFGYSIKRAGSGEPYTLVDNSTGRSILTGTDFGDISQKTSHFLDTGEGATSAAPAKLNPTTDIPQEVTDFLAKKTPPLTTEPTPSGTARPSMPSAEEITSRPGANTGRLAKLLGPKLYGDPSDMSQVTVKELFQNSFDAIKALLERKQLDHGKVSIRTDRATRTIQIYDNGSGMSPDVLAKQFLEIGGTHKETERSSGGLGIAKMMVVFANKGIRVVTMRDGKVSRLASTGDELFHAMDNPEAAPKVQISPPTDKELQLFPEGHGSMIEVTIPHSYTDTSTGEKKYIYFPETSDEFPVLQNSPLLDNITVHFNGQPVKGMGTLFPLDSYTSFADVKFGWGTGHIYVSKAAGPEQYSSNLHVLSNGLWQFSTGLKVDPSKTFGPNIGRTFYFDLNSKVRPEDPGYPFDLNRQQFTKQAREDIGKILDYMSALYAHEELGASAINFGRMFYLQKRSTFTGGAKVARSKTIVIEPKSPAKTPVNLIRPGDKVTVIDGRIRVNGREVPILDPNEVSKMKPNVDELKVDQSEIDPNSVMIHDNTQVRLSDIEAKSVTELGHEKFGQRFDDFMHFIGDSFIELRNEVASLLPEEFGGLRQDAAGISFDIRYRGVSIRVPFTGIFVNPAVPEAIGPLQGPVGIIYTMLHELAHKNHRSEDGLAPYIQKLATYLDTSPTFNFPAFKQRFVSSFAQNWDIFEYINGFFTGAFDIGPYGRSLKDSGPDEIGIVRRARTGTPARDTRAGASSVSGEVAPSEAGPTQQPRHSVSGSYIAEGGNASFDRQYAANRALFQAIDPGQSIPYPQSEVEPLRAAMQAVFGGTPPPPVAQLAVHADHMNKLYKWAYGLDRLVDLNPRFTPLLRYAERDREARLDTSKIHDAGIRIAKMWRRLGDRAEGLAALIDDVTNMTYRTATEAKRGIVRHPSKTEFEALLAQHKIDGSTLRVFTLQKKFFSNFLELVTQNARDAAQRIISDPVELAKKLDTINAQKANLEARPYFPFTRFGTHFVNVRNVAGDVVYFETFERKGLRSAESQQKAKEAELKRGLPLGHKVTVGVLPETATPLVGLPPELLESISKELNLTPDQQGALDQIRYQMAPAASFVHHLQQKRYVKGYSHDFLRAFSRYAFHGGRYYGRVKYAWALRDEIKAARAVPGNKAGAIANYMEDHLQNAILDARGDYGALKGGIFLWVFGYSPVGAFINLSQIPMLTYPFLAAKYGGLGVGDVRASKAILKAMTKWSNFWRKGSYDNLTAFEMRAMSYGIKTQRISEAMTSELAGLAQGENLLGLGNSKAGRGMQVFMEKAAWFFEMAEQADRRTTYMATLDLAMQHPDALGVKEALLKYADEFIQLQASRFNKAEARAIIAAVHATDQTQFVYSRSTRPRFMRGPLAGSIFVFKTYVLNTLQLLGANKSSVMPRYLLVMFLLAGLMGIPGAEDAVDIAKLLGKWLFGKDFNPKLALRQLILDVAGGKLPPDLVLDGLARKGFGLPALMDLMGQNPGRGLGGAPDSPATRLAYQSYATTMQQRGGVPLSFEAFRRQHSQNVPVPQFDLSRSLSMGRLLPFDLGKFTDPGQDTNQAIAGTAQQASGAIFSVGFNLYKALNDSSTPASDLKRWEKTMPRALASASRAYRAFTESRERSKGGPNSGATIAPYDIRDPEQAAEIIGMAMGFMPTRQNAQWDSIMAQAEVTQKFKVEKTLLEQQMFEAVAGQRKEEIDRVRQAIMDWNKLLPQWAKGESITGQGLKSAMKSRALTKAYREAGVPRAKGDQPIAQHVQGLFPESVVDVRKVQ